MGWGVSLSLNRKSINVRLTVAHPHTSQSHSDTGMYPLLDAVAADVRVH